METTMTATETRIHFGEVLRRVSEGRERVIVHRSGNPIAVILSAEEYERLARDAATAEWRELLNAAHERVRSASANGVLPDPAEVIRTMREERDERLLGLR